MFELVVSNIKSHFRQLVLPAISLAITTAVIITFGLLWGWAKSGERESAEVSIGTADLWVTSSDAKAVDKIRSLPEVQSAEASVSLFAEAIAGPSDFFVDVIPTLSADFAIADLKGRPPLNDREAVISSMGANELDVGIGDRVTLFFNDLPTGRNVATSVQIVGIRSVSPLQSLNSYAVGTVEVRPSLMEAWNKQFYPGIDGNVVAVQAASATSMSDLISAIDGLNLADNTITTRTGKIGEILQTTTPNLAWARQVAIAISLVPLGVTALLAGIAVVGITRSRSHSLAILRMLGGSRLQVFLAIVIEAIITASLPIILGVAAGFGIAQAVVNYLTEEWGGGFLSSRAGGSVWFVLWSVLLVGAVTIIPVAIAALRASRITPLSALTPKLTPVVRKWRKGLAAATTSVAAVLFLYLAEQPSALGFSGLQAFPITLRILFIVLGAFFTTIALALFHDQIIKFGARNFIRLHTRRWGGGRMSGVTEPLRVASTRLARSDSITATSTSIAIIVAGFLMGVGTYVSTTTNTLSQEFSSGVQHDLRSSASGDASFSPEQIAAVRSTDGVAGVLPGGIILIDVDNPSPLAYGMSTQVISQEALDAYGDAGSKITVPPPGTLSIPEEFAKEFQLKKGDLVKVTSNDNPEATISLKVDTHRGYYVKLSEQDARALTSTYAINQLWVDLTPAAENDLSGEIQKLNLAIASAANPDDDVPTFVSGRNPISSAIAGSLIDWVPAAIAFLVIALLAAAIAVGNSTSMVVRERETEIRLLRSMGVRRLVLARSMVAEAAVISILAAVLAILVGWVVGVYASAVVLEAPWSAMVIRMPWLLAATIIAVLLISTLTAALHGRKEIARPKVQAVTPAARAELLVTQWDQVATQWQPEATGTPTTASHAGSGRANTATIPRIQADDAGPESTDSPSGLV